MTPDLFEAGTERLATHQARVTQEVSSGDRSAGYGRVHEPGSLDLTHGRILYLEDVNVSFDGFKAINGLSLDITPGELRCIIGPNGAAKFFLAARLICCATTNRKLRSSALAASSKNPRCLNTSPSLKT
jgi:ABC-type molybdenum transport system ATPase subunit/photorepair protein PhrA